MTLDTYFLYLATIGIFFAAPPDSTEFIVMANATRLGLRKTLWTIAGDLSANSVQMVLAAFSLSLLIGLSAHFFMVIKWLGVAYLIWLGIGLIRSDGKAPKNTKSAVNHRFALYRQGFVISMTNPYAIMFFGALFPQFINAEAAIAPQLLILGATYLCVDGLSLLSWGWAAKSLAKRFTSTATRYLGRISGAMMIIAALLLGIKDITPDPSSHLGR